MTNEQIKMLYFFNGDNPKVEYEGVTVRKPFVRTDIPDTIYHDNWDKIPSYLNLQGCTIHLYRLEDALKVIPKKHLLHTDKFWLQKQLNLDFEHRTQRVNNLLINHNIWVDNECDGIKFIEA